MLYYGRTDVSKGVDVNKMSELKKCDICCYCYVLDNRFKFRTDAYNGCHDVLMLSMNFSNIAILNINGLALYY